MVQANVLGGELLNGRFPRATTPPATTSPAAAPPTTKPPATNSYPAAVTTHVPYTKEDSTLTMSLEDECIRAPNVTPIAGTTSLTSALIGSSVRRFVDSSIDNTIITYTRSNNRILNCHGSWRHPPKKRKASEEGDGSEENE
jgi:hypothetical protein